MNVITNFDYIEELDKRGIIVLTGEACRAGFRYLCDLTEEGKALLETYFGVSLQIGASNWNSSKNQKWSIMLSHSSLRELLITALLEGGDTVLLLEDQIITLTTDEFNQVQQEFNQTPSENKEESYLLSLYKKKIRTYRIDKSQPGAGLRCTHAMSGRTV
jgi:hypothetical protein